jgi:HAD superfamily hydrolase (TIGR01509 family)
MYNLDDIIVSDSHVVKYKNNWIRVSEHPDSIKYCFYDKPYLYCLNTQNKTIDIIKKNAHIRQEKVELLEYLKKNNYFVACYTNSIRNTAELMLKRTGILELFDLIITNQDVNFPKPDPEGYNKIISFFNLSPKETVIVEDSPKGIEAAIKTGSSICVVKNPNEVTLELLRSKI